MSLRSIGLAAWVLFVLGASGSAFAEDERASTEDGHHPQTLRLRAKARPQLLDYEIPGHPRLLGETQAGAILSGELIWDVDEYLSVELGVMMRLPFAHDFEAQLGAFPLFALAVRPTAGLLMRLGSLDIRHGYHPAVVDEVRYAYGRDYQANYNRSITPEAQRDLGGDPFMPVENGAQLIADVHGLHAEVFVDWQLIETSEHREKFAVGVLGSYRHRYFEAGFQYRLLHYGGQIYTQEDPIRAAGLDPKRQPTTLALHGLVRPLKLDWLTIEIPLMYVRGRVVQTPGGKEENQQGFEPGLDLRFIEVIRLGYRFWYPDGEGGRFTSEDADPVYSGPRSHRATIEAGMKLGVAELLGRLDLVFPTDSDKVQTLAVTVLSFTWEPVLWTKDES